MRCDIYNGGNLHVKDCHICKIDGSYEFGRIVCYTTFGTFVKYNGSGKFEWVVSPEFYFTEIKPCVQNN